MRRTLPLVCLLLSLIALSYVPAEAEAALNTPAPVLRLPWNTWQYHSGDDPHCASPSGTDTRTCEWTGMAPPPSWYWVPSWRHIEVELPPSMAEGPTLSLLMQGLRPVYEVYVNGELAGSSGSFLTLRGPLYSRVVIAIPPRLYRSGRLTVAVRSLNGPSIATPPVAPELGASSAIAQVVETDTLHILAERSQYFLSYLFVLGAGSLFLLLFALDTSAWEYLWLAFILLSPSILRIPDFAGVVDFGMQRWAAILLYGPMNAISAVGLVEFPFALLRRRVWPALRIIEVLGGSFVVALLLLLPWSFAQFSTLERLWGLLILKLLLPALIVATLTLLIAVPACFRSAQHDMKWIGAALIFLVVTQTDRFVAQLRLPALPQFIQAGTVTIELRSLALVLFSAVMMVTMLIRFRRLQRRNQTVEQDLTAARSVQQVLIPDALPQVPGLTIESAYLPAQEVGGDFFQVLPLADGGAFVVVGDVAGKGLQAAMTVAVIVGALRVSANFYASPGDLLAELNRQLCGRGTGFATCLALAVEKSGRVRMANAGHLNPYLDGAEVATEPDLPLGVVKDANYCVTELDLRPGQTLTLMTDGVVEATDPRTHELFGFARTEAISRQSAGGIAQAAHAFGVPQADDITVLTLSYPA